MREGGSAPADGPTTASSGSSPTTSARTTRFAAGRRRAVRGGTGKPILTATSSRWPILTTQVLPRFERRGVSATRAVTAAVTALGHLTRRPPCCGAGEACLMPRRRGHPVAVLVVVARRRRRAGARPVRAGGGLTARPAAPRRGPPIATDAAPVDVVVGDAACCRSAAAPGFLPRNVNLDAFEQRCHRFVDRPERRFCVAVSVDGVPVAAYNATCPFSPQSNMKLIVAAVALEVLGEDHRFTTIRARRGRRRGCRQRQPLPRRWRRPAAVDRLVSGHEQRDAPGHQRRRVRASRSPSSRRGSAKSRVAWSATRPGTTTSASRRRGPKTMRADLEGGPTTRWW